MPSVTDEDDQWQNLDIAIENLNYASTTAAKLRTFKLPIIVNSICHHAFQQGLTATDLERIIDIVIVKSYLDQASITSLIKNLYPAERVPSNVAIRIVGALGQGQAKPSPSAQIGLVKWLSLIYHVLEEPNTLSRLYGVLFSMLDMVTIRTPLCNLLAIITRRRHVRPFRIQQLLELCRIVGNEPALVALLRVYKDYYPDIIIGNIATGRTSLPTADLEWRKRLSQLQEANARTAEDTLPHQDGFRVVRNGSKRSKVSVVPEVHTFHANEASITLEEIESVEDFVEKLDRLEPPSQIASALTDPLLQKFIVLNPSDDSQRRLELWLSGYLQDELESIREGHEPSASLPYVLEGMLNLTRTRKGLLPVIEAFLSRFLPQWDGVTSTDTVISLLVYLPLRDFKETHREYISWLEAALTEYNPAVTEKLLQFYSSLFRHWSDEFSLKLFSGDADAYRGVIKNLFDHVSTIAMSAITASPPTATVAVLEFYTTAARCIQFAIHSGVPDFPVILPPPQVVYHLALGSSLSDLGQICSALANYKLAFEEGIKKHQKYLAEVTNQFNGHLMDICNLLWRSRAFTSTDPNSKGFRCSQPVSNALLAYLPDVDHTYGLPAILGLSSNPLTCALSNKVLQGLEDMVEADGEEIAVRHAGPANQRSLTLLGKEGGVQIDWKTYRVEILRWLELMGVDGIKALMFATMKDLQKTAVYGKS